jgi:hypothetical protein
MHAATCVERKIGLDVAAASYWFRVGSSRLVILRARISIQLAQYRSRGEQSSRQSLSASVRLYLRAKCASASLSAERFVE